MSRNSTDRQLEEGEQDPASTGMRHSDDDAEVASKRNNDLEMQKALEPKAENVSAFKALGWLDRFLAIWILLAIVVGILIGNFVPSAEEGLQKGKFVGVSIPVGMYTLIDEHPMGIHVLTTLIHSHRLAGHDVPNSVQSPV